jgi:hypothetical protein
MQNAVNPSEPFAALNQSLAKSITTIRQVYRDNNNYQ